MSEMSKRLSHIPELCFEREFEDFGFAADDIASAKTTDLSTAEIILELSSPSIFKEAESRLLRMQSRLQTAGGETLFLCGSVLLLFGDKPALSCLNPLLVALFLKSEAAMSGKSMNPSRLCKEVLAYEEEFKPFLEKLESKKAEENEGIEE